MSQPLSHNILENLYLKFLSRKTTIALIAILAFFYFLGLVIPQQSIMPPEKFAQWQSGSPTLVQLLTVLKLTRVYSSPIVILITALFFLNLLLVLVKRVPLVIKQMELPESITVASGFIHENCISQEVPLKNPGQTEIIKEKLRAKRFTIISGDKSFKGIKNNFSSLGSLSFHASFIIFLAGGLLIFHTRFWGETFVTEGQSFSGERGNYRSVVRWSELRKSLPEIKFTIDKITPQFEKMEPVSLKTFITAEAGGYIKKGSIEVNYPFKLGTTSLLVTDIGVAPLIIVTDTDGQEIFGAFVSLNVMRGDEDHFILPDTGDEIRVKFWPDYASDDKGNAYTRSFYLNNPLFLITVVKNGVPLVSGTMKPPQDTIAFDNKKISVRDIRYFGRFVITDEKGGGILIAGFIFAIVGLMLKFVWAKKEIYGIVEVIEGLPVLLLGYREEYFKGFGKREFEKLLSGMRD